MFQIEVSVPASDARSRDDAMLVLVGRDAEVHGATQQHRFYGWVCPSFQEAVDLRRRLADAGYRASVRES